jgi:hypothetical protein
MGKRYFFQDINDSAKIWPVIFNARAQWGDGNYFLFPHHCTNFIMNRSVFVGLATNKVQDKPFCLDSSFSNSACHISCPSIQNKMKKVPNPFIPIVPLPDKLYGYFEHTTPQNAKLLKKMGVFCQNSLGPLSTTGEYDTIADDLTFNSFPGKLDMPVDTNFPSTPDGIMASSISFVSGRVRSDDSASVFHDKMHPTTLIHSILSHLPQQTDETPSSSAKVDKYRAVFLCTNNNKIINPPGKVRPPSNVPMIVYTQTAPPQVKNEVDENQQQFMLKKFIDGRWCWLC